jgi:hypothetical protein
MRDGAVRRTGEGLLAVVGPGVLSVGFRLDDLQIPVRIVVVVAAIALLAPVRHRLSPEAWISDGPRSPGRHALSAGLFVLWIVLLIASGALLGEWVVVALLVPGLAVGFVGSYALGDAIADYCMSPQFTSMEPASDDVTGVPAPLGHEPERPVGP